MEKTAVIGHIGIMLLSCGTSAWRAREAMNRIAALLGMTCSCDIGFKNLSLTCTREGEVKTIDLSLPATGVNTHKLTLGETFARRFRENSLNRSCWAIHRELERIERMRPNYSAPLLGLASGAACCAFTFLLGGGPVEMLCAFIGAGLGNWVKTLFARARYTLLLCITMGVATGCTAYALAIRCLEAFWGVSPVHEAGYICAMLFVIPGFPFITSFIDMAKQDMRSGLERLNYALMIIITATAVAWLMALIVQLSPGDFEKLPLSAAEFCGLRLLASFVGVFGFSIMFNSPKRLAAFAGCIGAVANTLRLELVDLADVPAPAAAFAGALTAGLLAGLLYKGTGFPRISVTVPSIVIMVPGLYMYKAFYTFGEASVSSGAYWSVSALLIVLALPMGLIAARILTDRSFRRRG